MNRTTIIEVASKGDAEAVITAINAGIAKMLKKGIKIAKKEMNFSAAAVLLQIQPKYGDVPVGKKTIEVDMSKFSQKVEFTMLVTNKDFNSLVIGYCNQVGKLVDNKVKDGKEIFTFALQPADAKKIISKLAGTKEVTTKILQK